jgi:chemotaxis family two-component system sensor kinase Cph1
MNQYLEHFAYTVAHDLKEPLRTIGATVELFLLRKKSDLDVESSQMLESVVRAVGRIRCLLHNIMGLATATNAAGEKAAVNVDAVVVSAMANLTQAIIESGARIVVDQLPVVWANEGAMLRLFQNLIENAIKYQGDNTTPEIYISSTLRGAEHVFSIKDNGIGIDPKFYDKIFEPFQKLHGRSEYEGSGLGLAACRRIIKSLNGRIWVESKLGQGSTFFFTIPK